MRPDGTWDWLGQTPAESVLILAAGTLAFAAYYAREYRRWGVLSVGSWILGFDFYVKIVLMYPFALSPENILAVGNDFPVILSHLDQALHITAAGVAAMACGMVLSRATAAVPHDGWAPPLIDRLLDRLHDALLRGWSGRASVAAAFCLAAGSTLLLLALGFEPLKRDLAFERPEVRPAYNLWSQLLPFAAMCLAARGLALGSSGTVLLAVLVALAGALGGNRTVVVLTLAQIWVMWAMPARRRGLLLPLLGAAAVLGVALAINAARGTTGIGADALDEFLYGNQLSDVRDFAWVLSGLRGEYYHGLTYLAGYLAFVPTALLEFRYDMAFGRVSATLAGLNAANHAGLRTPLFGELYVNFALPGVVLGGGLFGYVLGRILGWVARALEEAPGRRRHSPQFAVWTAFLAYQIATSFAFTPAFFGVYVLLVLLATGAVVGRWAR